MKNVLCPLVYVMLTGFCKTETDSKIVLFTGSEIQEGPGLRPAKHLLFLM